nr:AglZ/HisF2 family acetamidino modification protein [uncultured Methanoregula sp.]
MIRTRVIPCLLLKGQGLVKTVAFTDPKYVGDPINAVKIFNDKEVHELVFLDITASIEKRAPRLDYIADIASECFMPLGYGGGIRTVKQAEDIFNRGVEKIILNSYAVENPSFIQELADLFGSQSIVVSVDVKKNFLGNYQTYTYSGKTRTQWDPVTWAKEAERLGAGEIFLNSIDRDGKMNGYDIPLIKKITENVGIPVIACGGAGNILDFGKAIHEGGASAVSAGSLFVFHGKYKAVLINFPSDEELKKVLS